MVNVFVKIQGKKDVICLLGLFTFLRIVEYVHHLSLVFHMINLICHSFLSHSLGQISCLVSPDLVPLGNATIGIYLFVHVIVSLFNILLRFIFRVFPFLTTYFPEHSLKKNGKVCWVFSFCCDLMMVFSLSSI
jgi:hypothetical protein